jgi:hypothetical protein
MPKLSNLANACLLVVLFLMVETIKAQSTWSVEFNLGAATNVPMPLRIDQQGYSSINLNARYETASFKLPVYWDWRIGRWENGRSWEFEAIHHKLYLSNKPDEVQGFSISHGFNLLLINRGFDIHGCRLKTGVGAVLAHPESSVRNQQYQTETGLFNLGYLLSGPAVNLAVGKQIRLSDRFYLSTEAKTTYGFAKVPIANGTATVNNWAFHLAVGLGYDVFFIPTR